MPEQFKNTYRDELTELLKAKYEGRPPEAESPVRPIRGAGLRERLQESIEEVERERRTHKAA